MSEFELKLAALYCSGFMLFQALVIRRVVGTFIFPAAIFSLAWFFYTAIPLVLLFEVPINPVPIAYISLCSLMFTFGSLPFDWKKAFVQNKNKDAELLRQFGSQNIRFCHYGSSFFAIILSAFSLAGNGVDFHSLFSNLSETSGAYAARRGNEQLAYGVVEILSYLLANITPVFGALLFDGRNRLVKKTFGLVVSFAPAVLYMLTQSSKIIMLTSVLLYFSAFLLIKIYRNDFALFKIITVIKTLFAVLVLVPLISFSLLSRQLFAGFNSTQEMFGNLKYGFSSYLLGQVYAFSDFFSYYLGMDASQTYKEDYNSFGYYTFKAFFDSFGGTKYFPPTFYEEGYFYGTSLGTNIFTIFRSLIYDFGWGGSLFFFFICGAFIHFFYYRLLCQRRSWASCTVFLLSIVFIFMSYLFSIFTSRYMTLIGTVFFVVLHLNDRLRVK